jgi:3-oxoacyl-[acyl-carrier protein] reductase
VLALARQGADIAINHRSEESAAEALAVAEACQALGVRAMVCQADVSDDTAVASMLKEIEARLGAVSICVNNAGIMRTNFVILTQPAEFRQVLQQNLESAFIVTRAVLRGMMRRKRGKIVNVSSDAAILGDLMRAAYSASKAGLLGLTRSTAREVAASGITVNAVCPGMIDTRMTSDIPETRREKMLSSIPMRRFGTSGEVAAAIAFLCSPAADYITGATLHVNGGLV